MSETRACAAAAGTKAARTARSKPASAISISISISTCASGASVDRESQLPSLRANGWRECAPDDRLREAIHLAARKKAGLLRRYAPRNDGKGGPKRLQFVARMERSAIRDQSIHLRHGPGSRCAPPGLHLRRHSTILDGIAAGLSRRQREFFDQPRCIVVDDDGDIPTFACPHPRLGNRDQRTVPLHSHRFTFLFRNNFKPHMISPTLNWGYGCRWICRQFARTMSRLRARMAEIGQVSAAVCPTGKSAGRWRFALSSPICKNISVFPKSKSGYMIAIPSHRGALAIVIDAGRDAMDAAASGTRCNRFQRHSVCGRMALFPLSLEFRRTGTHPPHALAAGLPPTANPFVPAPPTLPSS